MIGGAVAEMFGVTFIPAIPAYLGNNLFGYLAMIVIGMGVAMGVTKILVKKN